MKRRVRLVLASLSVLLMGFAIRVEQAEARSYPCYACAGSCEVSAGEGACQAYCGMSAMYCIGNDDFGFCSGPRSVIECGEGGFF